MNPLRLLARVVAVAIVLGLCGCASIVSGRTADVRLNSQPPNAHVVVRDHEGVEVAQATTPAVVALKRKRKFFLPARYTATFDAPGYETQQVELRSTVNPWVAGNVVLGGVVGLVVDNATGAAWKPKSDELSPSLTPMMTAQQQLPPGAEQAPTYVAELVPAGPTVQPASATY